MQSFRRWLKPHAGQRFALSRSPPRPGGRGGRRLRRRGGCPPRRAARSAEACSDADAGPIPRVRAMSPAACSLASRGAPPRGWIREWRRACRIRCRLEGQLGWRRRGQHDPVGVAELTDQRRSVEKTTGSRQHHTPPARSSRRAPAERRFPGSRRSTGSRGQRRSNPARRPRSATRRRRRKSLAVVVGRISADLGTPGHTRTRRWSPRRSLCPCG